MPEALTKWKFLGFAHDKQLRGGLLTDSVVTAKDLMVQPNPAAVPARGRCARVHRQGHQPIADAPKGHGAADLRRRADRKSIDRSLGTEQTDQTFEIPPAIAVVLLETERAGRAGIRHLQSGRLDRTAVRRRGRLSCPCCRGASWSPNRCRCRSAVRRQRTSSSTELLQSGDRIRCDTRR